MSELDAWRAYFESLPHTSVVPHRNKRFVAHTAQLTDALLAVMRLSVAVDEAPGAGTTRMYTVHRSDRVSFDQAMLLFVVSLVAFALGHWT